MKKIVCNTERLVLYRCLTLLIILNLFIFSANAQTANREITGSIKDNDVLKKKLTAELLTPQADITPINITKIVKPEKKNNNSLANRGGFNQTSALTVRTWTGATNNTFNVATNWNPNAVPSATDSCVIVLAASKTISLNAGITIGALNLSISGNNVVVRLDAVGNTFTINGTTTLRTTGGNANTQLQVNVGNGGSIVYAGSVNCTSFSAANGTVFPILGAGGTTGTVTFKGDVSYTNAVASSSTNLPASVIFDATGTQTINNISSLYLNPWPTTVLFGSANTPTVTITGLQASFFPTANVTVKANAAVIMPGGATTADGGTLNNFNGAGVFTLNAGSVLKLGASQGDYGGATGSFNGVAGSNFPGAYTTYAFNATSITEYNSLTTVNQTIYNIPTYGNLTLTNGSGAGATTKTAGGNLTMNGNVTINALATFAASTFSHSIKGNWTNAGTFTANTSTVTFNGTVAQAISGASATTFNSLTINNTSGTGVTLSQAINAGGTLTMSSGNLFTTSSNILTLTPGAVSTAGTSASASYVDGPMIIQKNTAGSSTLNFPIGKSADCRPVVLTVNHSDVTLYNYNAELFNADAGALGYTMPATNSVDTVSGVHYWIINRTDGGGASQPSNSLSGNQTIQLFFGTNDFVYQGSTLTIVKNTSAAPTTWFDIGGSSTLGNFATPQAGNVSSTSAPTAFTSFSTFTLGSKTSGWNSLPIELLNFSAVTNENKVDIKWSTATETNNKYFTIEKSKDGKTFVKLMDVKGAGNSITYREYLEADFQPYSGVSYYRLKQTDFNGAYKYYQVVLVQFNRDKGINIFPNPVATNNNLNLQLTGYSNQSVLLVLQDVNGKEYFSKSFIAREDNQLIILDEFSTMPAGVYVIVATSNNTIFSRKIIIK